MGTESLKASPAPAEQPRITEAEVRLALARTKSENSPLNPREAARRKVQGESDIGLLAMATELLPRDGKMLQKELEKEKKRSDVPFLIEAQKNALAVIGAYLAGLRQDLKANFAEQDFRVASRAYGKGIQKRIEEMLNQAQREGLVIITNGRLSNRVGYVSAWMNELKEMRNGPDLSPKQKQAILTIERFFQAVLNGDPLWGRVQKLVDARRPDSDAVQRGKGALKMLGVLAAAGMCLLSGFLDFKNKQISAYSLGWLALVGWSTGFFHGQSETVRHELAFVPTKEWENLAKKLGIQGKEGTDLIDFIQKAHRGKKGKKAMELLTKAKDLRSVDPKTYIPLLVGENPQGPEAEMATKLRSLSPQELYALCFHLTSIGDRTANDLIRDFAQHNVNSQTVAPQVRQLARRPSASAPSGTPPAHPPQG